MKKLLLLIPVLILALPGAALADAKPRVESVSVTADVVGSTITLTITADLPDHGKPRDVSAYELEGGLWCFDAAGVPLSLETHGTDLNMNSLPVPDADPVVLSSGPFAITAGASSCRAFVWFFPDIYTELVSFTVPVG